MTIEEKEEFDIDVRRVDWRLMTKIYIYGIQKYVMK